MDTERPLTVDPWTDGSDSDFHSPLKPSGGLKLIQGRPRAGGEAVWDRPLQGADAEPIGIHPARPLGGGVKRLTDLAIVVPLLVLVAPLMLLIAGLIAATGARPIFVHQRVGYGGKPFACLKFQTMVPDAEAALARYLADDDRAAHEWQERRKLRHDPRVTRLGHVLRKCSLDELPQLINVLRGEMSCVGPRPVTPDELERYGRRAQDYLSTRPGITGLWQVNGRSSTDFETRVAIDENYVRNWTLLMDLGILLKTPAAVLRIMEVH